MFIFSARNDVVFVNFYADWCRFSQILAPTFDEASRLISEEFTVSSIQFNSMIVSSNLNEYMIAWYKK